MGDWIEAGYDERERWLRGHLQPGTCQTVLAASDNGVSSFFRQITGRQPHRDDGYRYAYWDLLADPPRHPDPNPTVRFWATIIALIEGKPADDGRWVDKQLLYDDGDAVPDIAALAAVEACIGPEETLVIVLDGWDDAQRHGEFGFDLAACMALTSMVRAHPQGRDRAPLALIAVTHFPHIDILVKYARSLGKEGGAFQRLSGWLEREFTPMVFPMLGRDAAVTFCSAKGCSEDVAAALVDDVGGWLGLLALAADQALVVGAWDAGARAATLEGLGELLDARLIQAVGQRGESRDQAWKRVRDQLGGPLPKKPAYFGLPTAFGSPDCLPPLLRTYLVPARTMVVDLENLWMPYKVEASRLRANGQAELLQRWYPDGLDAFGRANLPRFIEWLAEREGVDSEHVVIAAKTTERADEVLGERTGSRAAWQILHAGMPTTRDGGYRKDQNDDAVAVSAISHLLGKDAGTPIVLVTGDQDHAQILDVVVELGGLELARLDLRVRAPYRLGGDARKRFPTAEGNLIRASGIMRVPNQDRKRPQGRGQGGARVDPAQPPAAPAEG